MYALLYKLGVRLTVLLSAPTRTYLRTKKMLFLPLPKLSHVLNLLLVLFEGATSVRASPAAAVVDNLVTMPFVKRFNFTGSTKILQRDQARARNLRARGISPGTKTSPFPSPEASSITAQNQLMQYIAEVRGTRILYPVDFGLSNSDHRFASAPCPPPPVCAPHIISRSYYGNL